MSVQIFVDESKRREFVMAAVSVRADHVGAYRRELRKHLRPGARRFHCTGVSDSDRRDFIAAIDQWPAVIDIFVSHSQKESEARRQCIRAVAIHAAETMAGRLVSPCPSGPSPPLMNSDLFLSLRAWTLVRRGGAWGRAKAVPKSTARCSKAQPPTMFPVWCWAAVHGIHRIRAPTTGLLQVLLLQGAKIATRGDLRKRL